MTENFEGFPLELQTKILEYANSSSEEDIGYLWTSLRNVSHTFRSIVDDLVRRDHLKRTSIHFPLETIWLEEGGKMNKSTTFAFDRISPSNPNVAIFKAEVVDEYKEMIKPSLNYAINTTLRNENPYNPAHKVFIREAINDTELQGVSMDWDNWELSCDWKSLFTAFWYEEKLIHKYMHDFVEEFKASNPRIKSNQIMEEDATPQFMLKALMAYAKSNEKNREKARRSRIARQCTRLGKEFDEETLEFYDERNKMDSAGYRGGGILDGFGLFEDEDDEDEDEDQGDEYLEDEYLEGEDEEGEDEGGEDEELEDEEPEHDLD